MLLGASGYHVGIQAQAEHSGLRVVRGISGKLVVLPLRDLGPNSLSNNIQMFSARRFQGKRGG